LAVWLQEQPPPICQEMDYESGRLICREKVVPKLVVFAIVIVVIFIFLAISLPWIHARFGH
jgi:hypothetical protein